MSNYHEDENFGDDELADDWEALAEAGEQKEKVIEDEARKIASTDARTKKKKKKVVEVVEDRSEEELSAALTVARTNLMTRAMNAEQASDLLGVAVDTKASQVQTQEQCLHFTDHIAEILKRNQQSESYALFLAWLAKELAPAMSTESLDSMDCKLDTVKNAAKHHHVSTAKGDTRRVAESRDGFGNVQDRVGHLDEDGDVVALHT